MDIDDSDFGCLGIPTPLEMWKQHSVLLATEIEEHQADLRRCRANIAKLVEINAALSEERDQLKRELTATMWKLSNTYVELTAATNALNGYRAWQANLAAAEAAERLAGELQSPGHHSQTVVEERPWPSTISPSHRTSSR